MKLDLLNEIFNNLKENKFVQNFINELSNYLDKNAEQPIIEDILSKNNVTTGNENSIRLKLDNVVLNYANQNFSNNSMCFVKDGKKTFWLNNKINYNNDVYVVLKVNNNKIEEIEINKKSMPKNINVNDVFKMEKGNYVIDNVATKELKEEIINMANEIIDKQNLNLEKHRKEGHLYMVTEELGNNRFLWDLTDASKVEFEEVNLSKDLLEKATQGIVLKYTNGNYEYYSDDGFERADKIHSTF
ncbi:MAG: hypothetical protein Q4G09_03045 [Clostridia bacterium]|nr:hypothetical protein [Clostridia bacterium]